MAPAGAPVDLDHPAPTMDFNYFEYDPKFVLRRPATKLMTRIEDSLPSLFSDLDISFLTPPRSRWSSRVSSNSSIVSLPNIPLSDRIPLTTPIIADFISLVVELQNGTTNTSPQNLAFTINEKDQEIAKSSLNVQFSCAEGSMTTHLHRQNVISSCSLAINEFTKIRLMAAIKQPQCATINNYMEVEHESETNIGAMAVIFFLPQSYSVMTTLGLVMTAKAEERKVEITKNKKRVHREDPGKEKLKEDWKEIIISCNYETEFTDKSASQGKMLCQLPHFVLYDLPDQETSQVIRMIFAYANIPYESKDVEEHIIEDFPLRNVPVLEIYGKKIGNNSSICRYLGWRFELSGQTAMEDSIVDMISETIQESKSKLKEWLDHIEYKNVDYAKPECSDAYALKHLDGYLCPVIEKLLRKSQSPWLVGYKLTWADFMVTSLFNPIIYHRPHFFDKYPNIYLHNKKIAELPQFEGMLYNVRERTFT